MPSTLWCHVIYFSCTWHSRLFPFVPTLPKLLLAQTRAKSTSTPSSEFCSLKSHSPVAVISPRPRPLNTIVLLSPLCLIRNVAPGSQPLMPKERWDCWLNNVEMEHQTHFSIKTRPSLLWFLCPVSLHRLSGGSLRPSRPNWLDGASTAARFLTLHGTRILLTSLLPDLTSWSLSFWILALFFMTWPFSNTFIWSVENPKTRINIRQAHPGKKMPFLLMTSCFLLWSTAALSGY